MSDESAIDSTSEVSHVHDGLGLVRQLARSGAITEAIEAINDLSKNTDAKSTGVIPSDELQSDQGVLAAVGGDLESAVLAFSNASEGSGGLPARLNLSLLSALGLLHRHTSVYSSPPQRVAVLSFLFNWPSRGGGIHHTIEFTAHLAKAGYEVRHLYVVYEPWGIGNVSGTLPFPSEALRFEPGEWNVASVRARFREALVAYDPQFVFILDAWNVKPHLAEAAASYRHFLVLQSWECLCPLNNVRLLPNDGDGFSQCSKNQLATPLECRACLMKNGKASGLLHRNEREFCGVGTDEYDALLRRAFANAEAVLAMNPTIEASVAPFARRVVVAPAAIDENRFPVPPDRRASGRKKRVLFAGVVEEPIKGFAVLLAACQFLWKDRNDFTLAATGSARSEIEGDIEWLGWHDPSTLAALYWDADICVVPSLAQESFGRVAAEAMAAGKPVVASRIGGLSYTVVDGVNGLLAEPGDAADLAAKIAWLLDHPNEAAAMGREGRARFEREFTWTSVFRRAIAPLLSTPAMPPSSANS